MTPYYEQDGIVIYHGDCREILPTLPKVDLVLTDPPYDAKTHRGAITVAASVQSSKDSGVSFSCLDDVQGVTLALLALSQRWVIAFCALEQLGAYAAAAGGAWVRAGVWDKIAPSPQITGDRPGQAVEGIAIMHNPGRKKWNRGGGAGIWRFLPDKGATRPDHPTPKPEGLMASLVSDFSDSGDTILDPFMGSGTTLVAAKRLGRKAIGIELEEKYCEIAARRLQQGALNFGT